MGSVVVSDVVNHFGAHDYNMFSPAHAHHSHQQDSQRASSAARPSSHAEPPAYLPRSQPAQHPVDTPMTDAVSHSSSASGHTTQAQQYPNASSARSSTSNPQPQPAQQLQSSSSRPPPSPHLRGGNPSSQHTPTSATNPKFPYPPSAISSASSSHSHSSPPLSVNSVVPPAPPSPNRIKVRSLSHIQSFANDELSPFSQSRLRQRRGARDTNDVGPQYEISEMPVADIIEMVAGLLTKITSTNDRQHEHIHHQIPPPEGTASLSQQTNSVLAFHGKNVPQISILSYLSRIHKYCPTTYEVFLSLLVYFDRMTDMVNSGPMQSMRQHQAAQSTEAGSANSRESVDSEATLAEDFHTDAKSQPSTPTPPPSGSLGKPAERGGDAGQERPPSPPDAAPMDIDSYNLSHFFVVDSYNIHRLVIAGVTCASKFFSDIFYTNSRYAKVGGLPLTELNHLELQFLLLNDFRLSVPLEEMQAYGTMLVEFYAREVVAQQESIHR